MWVVAMISMVAMPTLPFQILFLKVCMNIFQLQVASPDIIEYEYGVCA